jgi:hypothetical protein
LTCSARCCRGKLPGPDAATAERVRFATGDWHGLLILGLSLGLAIVL